MFLKRVGHAVIGLVVLAAGGAVMYLLGHTVLRIMHVYSANFIESLLFGMLIGVIIVIAIPMILYISEELGNDIISKILPRSK
jgi:hypothetical protein